MTFSPAISMLVLLSTGLQESTDCICLHLLGRGPDWHVSQLDENE